MGIESGSGRLLTVAIPRTAAGGAIDWESLTALLPNVSAQTPRIPLTEGWAELPFAGYHQTLVLKQSSRTRGTLAQATVRRVAVDGDFAAHLSRISPPGGLCLGVEPWASGVWNGLHVAWSFSSSRTCVIRRIWMLQFNEFEAVEVAVQYDARVGRHLRGLSESMVASLQPEPPEARTGALQNSVHEVQEALKVLTPEDLPSVPDVFDLTSENVGWLTRRHVTPGRLAAESMTEVPSGILAGGLATDDGTLSPSGRRFLSLLARTESLPPSAWFHLHGQIALSAGRSHSRGGRLADIGEAFMVEQPVVSGSGHSSVGLGFYGRDHAAEMVLRMGGHRPSGVSDTPVNLLPSDSFNRRLTDPTEPLPSTIPDTARVSSTMTPQAIHRWWTADWDWWWLYTEEPQDDSVGDRTIHRGIRVLRVDGFGHYEWRVVGDRPGEQGTMVELKPIDGLSLFHAVDEVLNPRS